MFTRPHAELGELIDVHRPMRPLIAWTFLIAISAPFAILAAVMPPGPVVGLAIFIGFLVPFTYMFAEWILLQHRIHRHGIVFRSVPGLRTYVVPFYTVQPERIEITSRHRVPRGEFRLAEPEHRECPLVDSSINFTGLDPKYARMLAKGKLAWDEAGSKSRADADAARQGQVVDGYLSVALGDGIIVRSPRRRPLARELSRSRAVQATVHRHGLGQSSDDPLQPGMTNVVPVGC